MIMRVLSFCRFVEIKAHNSANDGQKQSELVQDCFWTTTQVLVECGGFVFSYSCDSICHKMYPYRLIYANVSGIQLHCAMHSKLEQSRKFYLGLYLTLVRPFCLQALQGYKCGLDAYCLLWQTGNLKTVFRIAKIIMIFSVYACDSLF